MILCDIIMVGDNRPSWKHRFLGKIAKDVQQSNGIPEAPKKPDDVFDSISKEDWESFGIEEGDCGNLSPLSEVSEHRQEELDDLFFEASQKAASLVQKAESIFNKFLVSFFENGQITFEIFATTPMTKYDIQKIYNGEGSLHESRVSFKQRNANEARINIDIENGFFFGDEEALIAFDFSPITRKWFTQCVLSQLVSHLSCAGYSIYSADLNLDKDETESLSGILTVKWSPEFVKKDGHGKESEDESI